MPVLFGETVLQSPGGWIMSSLLKPKLVTCTACTSGMWDVFSLWTSCIFMSAHFGLGRWLQQLCQLCVQHPEQRCPKLLPRNCVVLGHAVVLLVMLKL